MISIVSHNCAGFLKENTGDSRAAMLMPLVILTDSGRFAEEGNESSLYKKACDLYHSITNLPETVEYKRFNLFAAELKLKYEDNSLKRFDLLAREELEYILDFIDTYGGFRIYQ